MGKRAPKQRRQKPVVKFQAGKEKFTPKQLGLKTYLEKAGPGRWDLYVCRGISCPRGPVAQQLCKMRCPQCLRADPSENLGSLKRRIDVLNEGHVHTFDVLPAESK